MRRYRWEEGGRHKPLLKLRRGASKLAPVRKLVGRHGDGLKAPLSVNAMPWWGWRNMVDQRTIVVKSPDRGKENHK